MNAEPNAEARQPEPPASPACLAHEAVPLAPPEPVAPGLVAAPAEPAPRITVGRVAQLLHAEGVWLGKSSPSEAIATLRNGTTVGVDSCTFRREVSRQVYCATGRPLRMHELDEILPVLEAEVLRIGPELPTAIRVHFSPTAVYVDLANESGQVAKVSAEGWSLVPWASVPVRFVRPQGTLPLPMPVSGGSVSELRPLLNVRNDAEWGLVTMFLFGCLGPPPYSALFVNGPQSAAKSSLCKLVRRVIDPRRDLVRRPPKRETDLVPTVVNNFVLAFDNVSEIPDWLADDLCSISSGATIATRKLYTNDGEILITTARPILANGIPSLTERPDLRDRSFTLRLSPLRPGARVTEGTLATQFEECHGRVLGALLDAAVVAIRSHHECSPTVEVRNIDAMRWCLAAEASFGVPRGTLEAALSSSRREAVEDAIEASAVAGAIIKLLDARAGSFTGTHTELLSALCLQNVPMGDWPKNPRALREHLDRLESPLGQVGVEIEIGERRGKYHERQVTLRRASQPVEEPPAALT